MDRIQPLSALVAVIEVMAALLACIAISVVIGVVLTMILAPPTYRAEIELERGSGASNEVILRNVDSLDVAAESTIIDEAETTTLVLRGMRSSKLPKRELLGALAVLGCRAGDITTRPEIELDKVLRRVARPYLSLQALVFLLAGALLGHFRLRRAAAEVRRGYVRAVLLGLGAGLASFTISVALGALMKLLGVQVQEQEWILELLRDRDSLIGLIPWIILIVPISEEVFFRGYVFRLLSQNAGAPIGFVLSSVMFALVHFNLTGIFIYIGIGMVLAWVYRATNNILAPVAGHVVHNTIVLTFLMMAPPA